jgi:organic radical activating enzyme
VEDSASKKTAGNAQTPDTFRVVKRMLDKVSPTFCIAKWSRVTVFLQHGLTHSCCYPTPHLIPLEELKVSPAALHNTKHKMQQRSKMLAGERASDCGYCWNIEDLGTGETSGRIFKSSTDASVMMLEEILKDPMSPEIKPKYFEVSFSSKCQLKCSYCSAGLSSSWQDEINQQGIYPGFPEMKNFGSDETETNPYVKAFWAWWPELKNGLQTFRITGGEPLLSPETFKVLEELKTIPQPQLNLGLNSNLSVPEVLFQKFNQTVKELCDSNSVKSFELFASIDSSGPQAEYIRHGLNHEKFWSNLEKFLSVNTNCKVTIMCTFGALSLFSFIPLLEKVLELNLKYQNSERPFPIYVETSYLHKPDYQSLRVLPDTFLPYMERISAYLDSHKLSDSDRNIGFANSQLLKFKAILEWMKQPLEEEKKKKLQKQFFLFFSEHDRRRNTDILKTFPELAEFWQVCRKSAEQD